MKKKPTAKHQVLNKLHNDFSYYAKSALDIRTKAGEISKLELNEAQHILHEVVERQLRETGRVRVIILKGRQQGLSTYVGGRLYHKTSKSRGVKTMVVSHVAESTETLFEMTKRYHDNCPSFLKPSTRYKSKKELDFDILDSSYAVATAGGTGIGRSETLQNVHASELAFWKPSTAAKNWNGLKKAVPNEDGTMVYIESTANGVGNLFHNLWTGAVKGENEYEAVFIPWYVQKEYRRTAPEDFEHTEAELKLVEAYNLDNDQLYWRRLEIGENGLDLFNQEYPCTPEEAFLTTGRPVFDVNKVTKCINQDLPIPQIMALDVDTFEEHTAGELKLFSPPSDGIQYYIGADVGAGIRGARLPSGEYEKDPSVAAVLDERGSQVAVWRGYVEPDYFGKILNALGELFNMATIAVESNNHGILPIHILSKELFYPYLYQVTSVDKVTNKETVTLGFNTTSKTKPLIIDQLRRDFRNDVVTVNDTTTLNEMLTFVVNEAGKMQAEEGCHDDTVIALAIANHIREETGGLFAEVNDNDYYEAL